MITHYRQHPLPVKAAVEGVDAPSIPLFLTKKEKKKVIRLRKKDKQDAFMEKRRLGLVEPPEPRGWYMSFILFILSAFL